MKKIKIENNGSDIFGEEIEEDYSFETLEGWLKKQAVSKSKANNSKWHDRYFVLNRFGTLIYYEETTKVFAFSSLFFCFNTEIFFFSRN